MTGLARARCPYCGEAVELVVDLGGASRQEYVEDCPVCCRPWLVIARWERPEGVHVELRREQD